MTQFLKVHMKSKNNPRASYSYLLKKIKFGIKNEQKNRLYQEKSYYILF